MFNDFGQEIDAKAPLGRPSFDSLKTPDEVRAYAWGRPWALFAISTGSNLVSLDVDMNPEKGKDGWATIFELGLEVSSTYELPTINHGHHVLYRPPAGRTVARSIPLFLQNGTEVTDVDRLAGGQLMILWSTIVPESLEELPVLPEEFCFAAPGSTGGFPFGGPVEEFLTSLPSGPPDSAVSAAIGKIPRGDFNRFEMLRRQLHLVRLGAEGHSGVPLALDILRNEWLRPPWNAYKNQNTWEVGLQGAIRKFGSQNAE